MTSHAEGLPALSGPIQTTDSMCALRIAPIREVRDAHTADQTTSTTPPTMATTVVVYISHNLRHLILSGPASAFPPRIDVHFDDDPDDKTTRCQRLTAAIWEEIIEQCEAMYDRWAATRRAGIGDESADAAMERMWSRYLPLAEVARRLGWKQPVDRPKTDNKI